MNLLILSTVFHCSPELIQKIVVFIGRPFVEKSYQPYNVSTFSCIVVRPLIAASLYLHYAAQTCACGSSEYTFPVFDKRTISRVAVLEW